MDRLLLVVELALRIVGVRGELRQQRVRHEHVDVVDLARVIEHLEPLQVDRDELVVLFARRIVRLEDGGHASDGLPRHEHLFQPLDRERILRVFVQDRLIGLQRLICIIERFLVHPAKPQTQLEQVVRVGRHDPRPQDLGELFPVTLPLIQSVEREDRRLIVGIELHHTPEASDRFVRLRELLLLDPRNAHIQCAHDLEVADRLELPVEDFDQHVPASQLRCEALQRVERLHPRRHHIERLRVRLERRGGIVEAMLERRPDLREQVQTQIHVVSRRDLQAVDVHELVPPL